MLTTSLLCRRPFRPRRLVVVLAVVMLGALFSTPVAEAQSPPPEFQVETVCFSVHNPDDPGTYSLFGQRFTPQRATGATPVVVLVPGLASSTANWDFDTHFSVARNLAQAGYVVVSYDRLGFARSPYPSNGNRLPADHHRNMLHELVGAVKSGNYATAPSPDCTGVNAAPGAGTQVGHPTVAVMGHSAGAAIVEGYAGQYHDVAAVVQADYANQRHGPVADQRYIVTGIKILLGVDYPRFFDFRQQCMDFNIYPPNAVPSIANAACNPFGFLRSPAGEFTGTPALQQINNTFIPRTGSTPVLLGYADHDAAFPPDAANADEHYWRTSCTGCDITRLDQIGSSHLFQAHRVMPAWVNGVVGWLKSRGLRPAS